MAAKAGAKGHTGREVAEWAARVIPRAVAYARTLLRRSGDAEDVVHDVLCRLLAHPEYDLATDGEKLLFRSITNACINAGTRRREMVSLDTPRGEGPGLHAYVEARRTPDPSDLAAASELHEAVRIGLAALPAMQRAALELKSMQYSLNEIAGMLSVSATNAGVLVHRGRNRMAKHLAPMLSDGPEPGEAEHE